MSYVAHALYSPLALLLQLKFVTVQLHGIISSPIIILYISKIIVLDRALISMLRSTDRELFVVKT